MFIYQRVIRWCPVPRGWCLHGKGLKPHVQHGFACCPKNRFLWLLPLSELHLGFSHRSLSWCLSFSHCIPCRPACWSLHSLSHWGRLRREYVSHLWQQTWQVGTLAGRHPQVEAWRAGLRRATRPEIGGIYLMAAGSRCSCRLLPIARDGRGRRMALYNARSGFGGGWVHHGLAAGRGHCKGRAASPAGQLRGDCDWEQVQGFVHDACRVRAGNNAGRSAWWWATSWGMRRHMPGLLVTWEAKIEKFGFLSVALSIPYRRPPFYGTSPKVMAWRC